jgi:peptidoglycan/LPS O-acetylase OafA/YrhL
VRHIRSLDGIRAVSFMIVFLAHVAPRHMVVPGDFGVTVFFFLSGFLITTLMRSEFETTGSVNIQHFWVRRALRILPPFYLVLLAAILIAMVLYPAGTLHAPTLAAQLLFVANYEAIYGANREAPGTGVLWSLAVEEHFYLLFPWLYVAMQRWRMPRARQALLLWALCALVLAWRFVLTVAMHSDSQRIYIATDTRVESILFGCALAVWINPVLDDSPGRSYLWKYALLPAALIALMGAFAYRNEMFRQTWYFSVQGLALTIVFIAAIRFWAWTPFRFLNLRPVAFLGVLSYSLYLVHQVVLSAVTRLWPQWYPISRAGTALGGALIVAYIIHLYVERPCARLRKSLTDW